MNPLEPYILTVSLNAAVDVVYTLPALIPGAINVAATVLKVGGGKANNVARVLAQLGRPVLATGFAGGAAGQLILSSLQSKGVRTDYEPMAGENRTCTTILATGDGTVSELREKGPTLTEADAERFFARFQRLLQGAAMVVLSGSLPPGVRPSFYGDLVRAAKERSIPVILDATGAALREAAAGGPALVKPNREELVEWAGRPLPTQSDLIEAARGLLATGPEQVAVSLGAEGMLLVTPTEALLATPPRIQPRNTVGSGDSAVAGFATALHLGLQLPDSLRLAVACGTANAMTNGVAEVDPTVVAELQAKITVRPL